MRPSFLADKMRAFVFPGQGSQYCGMGKEVAGAYEKAGGVFHCADETLGFALSRVCFEGPEERLRMTEVTQPAVLTTSVALLRVLEDRVPKPDFVAGHSLGEYSALVAAGALRFEDAVRLVAQRGRFMQEAVPEGEGSMAAVIGLKLSQIRDICREAAQGRVVSPANINSADQVVISGHLDAVERAARLASSRGARRVQPLPVSAPFHCSLMDPAARRLNAVLEKVPFADLEVPLVSNVDAREVSDGEGARERLVKQVSSPVLWFECVGRLVRLGVTTFVEIGPGKVLTGLIRRIAPQVQVQNIETPEQLEAYVQLC